MQLLAPVTVTSTDFDVALVGDGISAAWTPGWVRVANESAFALKCFLGADTHWLQPWTVDLWPVHAVTVMHVHPVQLVTPLPTSQWSTVLVTVAQPWEEIPGTYPAPLGRQSSVFNNRQALLPVVTTPSASVTNTDYTLPPGTVDLRILLSNNGLNFDSVSLAVIGKTTSQSYFPGTPGSTGPINNAFLPITVPVDVEVDPVVTVSVNNASVAQPVTMRVSALMSIEAVEVYNQVPLSVAATAAGSGLIADTSQGFVIGIPAAGTANILNAGLTIRVWELQFDLDNTVAGSALSIEDSNGTTRWNGNAGVNARWTLQGNGSVWAIAGAALRFRANAAGALTARGHVSFLNSIF